MIHRIGAAKDCQKSRGGSGSGAGERAWSRSVKMPLRRSAASVSNRSRRAPFTVVSFDHVRDFSPETGRYRITSSRRRDTAFLMLETSERWLIIRRSPRGFKDELYYTRSRADNARLSADVLPAARISRSRILTKTTQKLHQSKALLCPAPDLRIVGCLLTRPDERSLRSGAGFK
jgi:hypothetical protein